MVKPSVNCCISLSGWMVHVWWVHWTFLRLLVPVTEWNLRGMSTASWEVCFSSNNCIWIIWTPFKYGGVGEQQCAKIWALLKVSSHILTKHLSFSQKYWKYSKMNTWITQAFHLTLKIFICQKEIETKTEQIYIIRCESK